MLPARIENRPQRSHVITLDSYIGGRWQSSDASPVWDVNPARPSEAVAYVHHADPAMATAAVEAAAAAFPVWAKTLAPERGALLRRAAHLLAERAEEIGRDCSSEEGKVVSEAVAETRKAASILQYFAGQALDPDGETYPSSSPGTFLFSRREPLGVVAAVTPWNFPIVIPAWKIAPALVFGNTVVWKPAEITPLTAVHLVRALEDAGLPAGVLNLVLGRGSVVGKVLTEHPSVRAITFTGSTPVGRGIEARAVPLGKKVQLEMGGKNPAVILADADMERAAQTVARAAFLHAGQKCTATSRVIVERAGYDEFSSRLVEVARTMRVGDPFDEHTRIGPLASQDQLDTVMEYLKIGRAEGAFTETGGSRLDDLGDGYFVAPTVLSGLDAPSRVVREEIFGPVAALLPAANYEEAVRLANDTVFGLSASLFTRDLDKAFRFAADSATGLVKVNQETTNTEIHIPFGGVKDSSSGAREQGKTARDFFTERKTVYITHSRS